MNSLELLLDDAADAAVRRRWAALLDAGLPSQARHTTAASRPHTTLIAAPQVSSDLFATVATAVAVLPVPVRLGAPLVFGTDRHRTLALSVVPTDDLLSLHALVFRLAQPVIDETAVPAHCRPGRWTPHITLARRLDGAQLTNALTVLDGLPGQVAGSYVALRRWDGHEKTEQLLSAPEVSS